MTVPDARRESEEARTALEGRAIEVVDARTHNLKGVSLSLIHI